MSCSVVCAAFFFWLLVNCPPFCGLCLSRFFFSVFFFLSFNPCVLSPPFSLDSLRGGTLACFLGVLDAPCTCFCPQSGEFLPFFVSSLLDPFIAAPFLLRGAPSVFFLASFVFSLPCSCYRGLLMSFPCRNNPPRDCGPPFDSLTFSF